MTAARSQIDAAAYADLRQWLARHGTASSDMVADSRDVKQGDIFLALNPKRSDGSRHIAQAKERGAIAVVAEFAPAAADPGLPWRHEPALRRIAARLAAEHYGDPSAELAVAAVTGTNGKTSTTHWIAQILDACGTPAAIVGTLGFAVGARRHADACVLTTPDAVSMQRLCRMARRQGARALALEASSIGLDQGRLERMHIDVAVFSNLTQDHLDYHGTFERYAAAKRALFDWPGLRGAVLNLDDSYGAAWAQELVSGAGHAGPDVIGYTILDPGHPHSPRSAMRTLLASDLCATARGTRFRVEDRGPGSTDASRVVDIPLLGRFNVANVLAAIGACLSLGMAWDRVLEALDRLQAPPGRMQAVGANEHSDVPGLPLVVVDYAHTPDAIEQALATLLPIARERGGSLWIVFGAGGDRDGTKRPRMGEAACLAGHIVVTSDNPRSEEPAVIIEQICAGCRGRDDVRREPDRARAIAMAITQAQAEDLILIAGKGHESTQEIRGVRVPFSDVEHARSALRARIERART